MMKGVGCPGLDRVSTDGACSIGTAAVRSGPLPAAAAVHCPTCPAAAGVTNSIVS